MDGEKYFLYAYSLSNYESLGEAYVYTCSIGAVLETYGYENVTSKVNAGCFKLYDAYSTSFNSSNVCKLFWS